MSKYDPVKAHEYYLKHRKLKGRKRAKLNTKVRAKKKKSGKAKKVNEKTLMASMNDQQKEQALEAQARIKLQKQEFTKKLNETIKAKIKEAQASATTDADKKIAAEKIKLQYAEVKKQANAKFKADLLNELKSIKG